MKNFKEKAQEIIATTFNEWHYFNELEKGIQVRKRRCLKTMLVQRLEKQEVWIFVKE